MAKIISVNDLRKNQFIDVDGQLGKVKEITKSKTGKHGGCKCNIKCKNVFNGKNIFTIMGSQDDVAVLQPQRTCDWTISEIPDREGTCVFINEQREEVTLKLDKTTLRELQEYLDDDQDLEIALLEYKDQYALQRVVPRKELKKGKRKY
jgi:translation elongation factor P/translation initiation factor 5A